MLNTIKFKLSVFFTNQARLVFTNGQVYHYRKGDTFFYTANWCKMKIAKVNP